MSIQNRWIQPEADDRPQGVHAGQPISPSASEQQNIDEQRREMSWLEPNMAPQRQEETSGPLFTTHEHTADLKGVVHPRFVEHPEEYDAMFPPSSTQALTDQGRWSKVSG